MTPDLNTLMTRYTQDLVNRQQAANQPQQDQPKKRNLIESLLPTGGAIAGSIIGTPVIGGAVGGGLGELLAEILSGQGVNPLAIGGQAGQGALGGAFAKLFGLGKAATQVGQTLESKGAINAGEAALSQTPKEPLMLPPGPTPISPTQFPVGTQISQGGGVMVPPGGFGVYPAGEAAALRSPIEQFSSGLERTTGKRGLTPTQNMPTDLLETLLGKNGAKDARIAFLKQNAPNPYATPEQVLMKPTGNRPLPILPQYAVEKPYSLTPQEMTRAGIKSPTVPMQEATAPFQYSPTSVTPASSLTPKTLEKGIGTTLRQSVVKGPTNINTLDVPLARNALDIKYGINGSNIAKAEKLKSVTTNIDNQLKSTLSQQPLVKNLQVQATDNFNAAALDVPFTDWLRDPKFKLMIQDANTEVSQAAKSGDLTKFYAEATKTRGQIGKYKDLVSSGANVNVTDSVTQQRIFVNNAKLEAIQNTIDAVAPQDAAGNTIRMLNQEQGTAYKYVEDLRKGGNIGGGGLFSFANRPAQAAADLVGRGIQKVENIPGVQLAGRTVVPAATGQAVARGAAGISNLASNLGQPPQSQAPTSDLMSQLTPSTQKTDQSPVSQFSAQDAAAAIAANDSKYTSQIMAIYNLLNPNPGQTPYGKPTAQQYSLAAAGMQGVSQLAALLSKDPGVVTRSAVPGQELPVVGGFVRGAAGTGNYQAIAHNIIDALLRLRTGAQANAQEIQLYQNQLFPQAGDSAQTIQTKLKDLQDSFSPFLTMGASSNSTGSDVLNQFSQ